MKCFKGKTYVRTYLDNDPELLIIIKIYFLNSLSLVTMVYLVSDGVIFVKYGQW